MTKNLAVETLGSKIGVLTQNDCACPKPGAVTLEAGLLKVRVNQDCACPNPSAVVLETKKAVVANSDCACPMPAESVANATVAKQGQNSAEIRVSVVTPTL